LLFPLDPLAANKVFVSAVVYRCALPKAPS
jgi:hypothetical protein